MVLIGDSTIDNASYVRFSRGLSVFEHLKNELSTTTITMLAKDGAVIHSVHHQQLYQVPPDASHLVISVGGNNALGAQSIIHNNSSSTRNNFEQAIRQLQRHVLSFETVYASMMEQVCKMNKKVILCTVYNPKFEDETLQMISSMGIVLFNDVIVREALKYGYPIVDLRSTFTESSDYANAIEPSSQGGQKFARAIKKALSEHDFDKKQTVIYKY